MHGSGAADAVDAEQQRARGAVVDDPVVLLTLLEAKDAEPRCGLIVVDLDSGRTIEWLRFTDPIAELYDVAVLPGVLQAEAVGFVGEAINERVAVEPEAGL